jgi:hypothetical protein
VADFQAFYGLFDLMTRFRWIFQFAAASGALLAAMPTG